ncbi:MAG: cobalt transporter CbiM [Halobacteriota archaeon]|nr:cobalt transporter CbiM [Halobacteriota archaeon]MDY6958258.1 cobalt transporter CbiM [Halobacteriota archaeon]
MVHISDGILSTEIWLSGYVITAVLLAIILRRMKSEDVPKLSVITAGVFVASLIHIPVGPTSAHFILNGLAGVTLGVLSFPSIFIAVLLQTLLFQHGGITTIGINTLNSGIPALIAYLIFRLGCKGKMSGRTGVIGGISGGIAVLISVIMISLELVTTGEAFESIAVLLASAHIPIIIIEAIATGTVVAFFLRVKPEILSIEGR